MKYKTFKDLEFKTYNDDYFNRIAAVMFFPNGFGISVVRAKSFIGRYYTYTDNDDEWEAAVLKGTNENDCCICYDTPITNDVIGPLKNDDVSELMIKIQKLKKAK